MEGSDECYTDEDRKGTQMAKGGEEVSTDCCVPAGGLLMVCSDSNTRSYVLSGAANLKIFSSATGYASISGSTGMCAILTHTLSGPLTLRFRYLS